MILVALLFLIFAVVLWVLGVLTFACPKCGKLTKNNAVCGVCGYEADEDIMVHAPNENPSQPLREADPEEVRYWRRRRQYPVGHAKNPVPKPSTVSQKDLEELDAIRAQRAARKAKAAKAREEEVEA